MRDKTSPIGTLTLHLCTCLIKYPNKFQFIQSLQWLGVFYLSLGYLQTLSFKTFFRYWLMSCWESVLLLLVPVLGFYSYALHPLYHSACISLYFFYLSHLFSYLVSSVHIVCICHVLPCYLGFIWLYLSYSQTELNLHYPCSWGYSKSYTQ